MLQPRPKLEDAAQQKQFDLRTEPTDTPPGEKTTDAYNTFWRDGYWFKVPMTSLRTSQVVDPPDGRLPPLTRGCQGEQQPRGRDLRQSSGYWSGRPASFEPVRSADSAPRSGVHRFRSRRSRIHLADCSGHRLGDCSRGSPAIAVDLPGRTSASPRRTFICNWGRRAGTGKAIRSCRIHEFRRWTRTAQGQEASDRALEAPG